MYSTNVLLNGPVYYLKSYNNKNIIENIGNSNNDDNGNNDDNIHNGNNINHDDNANKDFWEQYYSVNNVFNVNDIKIFRKFLNVKSDLFCKINDYLNNIAWEYNYYTNYSILQKNEDNIKYFWHNVYYNHFFHELFYKIILNKLPIENKKQLHIERAFFTGQLHGLSGNLHKDERKSTNYGPSIYLFCTKNWKPYWDGSKVFVMNELKNKETVHVEHDAGTIVMFPPNMAHKLCEISGYGLIENAFSVILEYHTIYK